MVRVDMEFLFESSTRYLKSEISERVRYKAREYKLLFIIFLGIELNTRREVPYLQATMYYFVYHIDTIDL